MCSDTRNERLLLGHRSSVTAARGASVLAGGPRQGTEVLTHDDRLLTGGVEDRAPAIGPQGQEPSEDLPSAHPDSPGARHRPEAESEESWQGPEEGRWCVVCVCACGKACGTQAPKTHSSSSTHNRGPTGCPAGVCTSTRVLRVCPHGTLSSRRSTWRPASSTRKQPRRARRGTSRW